MFAPLRRSIVYLLQYFTGTKEALITSGGTETSPDSLNDVYVRDSKIASSVASQYNLRERKVMNYAEIEEKYDDQEESVETVELTESESK